MFRYIISWSKHRFVSEDMKKQTKYERWKENNKRNFTEKIV